jgi:hypothetical protein
MTREEALAALTKSGAVFSGKDSLKLAIKVLGSFAFKVRIQAPVGGEAP